MIRRLRKTTATTLVTELLRQRDDFMTVEMIAAALQAQCTKGNVKSALVWLRKAQVVDCVVEPDGKAWWFALPPEHDQRHHAINETTPHTRKRRRKEDKA